MIFVDTSAFYAMHVGTCEEHRTAVEIRDKIAAGQFGSMVTTNYVLDELATLLRIRVGHEAAVEVGEAIRSSASVEIVWVSPKLEGSAWDLFKKREDSDFSFTDCTSFIVMKSRRMTRAFAFDRHFSQMGFETVPVE